MKIFRRHVATIAALVALCAGRARADGIPFTLGTLGSPVIYQGGTVMLRFLYQKAMYENQGFIVAAAAGDTYDPANDFPIFSNRSPLGTTFSFDPGTSFGLEPGSELIFSICTNVPNDGASNNISCGDFGSANAMLYSGTGHNFDGAAHARVSSTCTVAVICDLYTGGDVVAFEDIREVDPSLPPDHDYNDFIFSVEQQTTTIPEPATMTLLATGLVGLTGSGWFRRRRRV